MKRAGRAKLPFAFHWMLLGKYALPGRILPIGQSRPTLPKGGCSKSVLSNLAIRVCVASFVLLNATSAFAQEIVLRDLTRISGVEVRDVDNSFLSLANNQKISWDQVLQVQVDPVWQAKIEQRIEKFGLPLYRLKHRLRQKNYRGAFEVARDWYDNEELQFPGNETMFLVSRAVMLGRIDAGQAERALEPTVQALLLQQKCSREFLDSFPGLAFTEDEFRTDLCQDLSPVWSSADECSKQLIGIGEKFDLDQLVIEWPGLAVYFSSMAVHASQRERMIVWSPAMGAIPQLRPWQRILGSNFSRVPLSVLIRDTEGSLRVSTMYWWATAKDQQASKADRVLTLLKIVANYDDQFPALSKMALARAIELTDDPIDKGILAGQPNR